MKKTFKNWLAVFALASVAPSVLAQTSSGDCIPYKIPTPGSQTACPGGSGIQWTVTEKTCPSGNVTVSGYITTACGNGSSLDPGANGDTCSSYTIPTEGTMTSCPNGIGVMYKTTTKVCPSGTITKSDDYVTTGCNIPTAKATDCSAGSSTNQNSACAQTGAPANCGAGKIWTTGAPYVAGIAPGVAHCVVPNCDSGVADGGSVSCATAGLPGDTGTAYRWVYTTYTGGIACTQVSAGGFDTSGCSVPPPVTPPTPPTTPNCNSGVADGTPTACPAGYTGTAYTQIYTTYSGDVACTQVATGGTDNSHCTPTSSSPPPTPPTQTPNCDSDPADNNPTSCATAGLSGYTGTAYTLIYTAYSGGGNCTRTAAPGYDTSGCSQQPILSCQYPQVLNAAGTACVNPVVNGVCANGSNVPGGNSEEGLYPSCSSGTLNITNYQQAGNCISQSFTCMGSEGGTNMNCGYLEFHCQ